jgi:hypothetical protein
VAMRFELDPDQLTGSDNETLLAVLDQVLLELDRRLTRYAQAGHEVLDMADEGLLALRALARLAQPSRRHSTRSNTYRLLAWAAGDPRVSARPGAPIQESANRSRRGD